MAGVRKLPLQGRKDTVPVGFEWQVRAGTGPRAMTYQQRCLRKAQSPNSGLSQRSEHGSSWEPLLGQGLDAVSEVIGSVSLFLDSASSSSR